MRVIRRAAAHVREASERARLFLEVRVAARPRDRLAVLLMPARGPVCHLAWPRAVNRAGARAAQGFEKVLGVSSVQLAQERSAYSDIEGVADSDIEGLSK